MRELPGFYFDEERKRYFSLSSRPSTPLKAQIKSRLQQRKNEHKDTPDSGTRKPPTQNKLKHTLHDSLLRQKHSINRISKLAVTQDITSTQIARSYIRRIRQHPDPTFPFTSFCAYETADQGLTFALGDQRGFCFTARDDSIHPEYIMTSQVTSICSDNGITIFTSFGPSPAILIKNVNFPDALHILMPPKLQDVRTSNLKRSSFVVGMRKQALHFPDINAPQTMKNMHVGSDVFALCQEGSNLWTGARNGSVHLFDIRVNYDGMEILQKRFSANKQSTSITHIHCIREFELLISTLNGQAEVHDTRFIRRTSPCPTLTINGHIDNSQVLHNLGLAIDPFQEYLYMAGQDCQVRLWSLRNGKQIESPSCFHSPILSREFPAPVLGMQITRHRNQNNLWLISGDHFEQYDIP